MASLTLADEIIPHFHIFGNKILYGMKSDRLFKHAPVVREYSEPMIETPQDESWFWSHTPALQYIRKSNTNIYIEPTSVRALFLNMWFDDKTGTVTHLSQQYVRWVLKTIRTTHPDFPVLINTKSSALISKGFSVSTFETHKMHFVNGVTSNKCKCKSHKHTFDDCIHPDSMFVVGQPVCITCFNTHYKTAHPSWIPIQYLKKILSRQLMELVFLHYTKNDVRHILIGIIAWNTTKHTSFPKSTKTLIVYGKAISSSPLFHILRTWNAETKTYNEFKEMFGPVVWKQIHIHQKHHFSGIHTMNGLTLQNNRQFLLDHGWFFTEEKKLRTNKYFFGEWKKKLFIDPPGRTPFQFFKSSKGHLIINTHMYECWRYLLDGAKIDVRLCSSAHINKNPQVINCKDPILYTSVQTKNDTIEAANSEYVI